MTNVTNEYTPQPLSLVRGSGGYFIRLKAVAPDGVTPVSFTGATVIFTAESGAQKIVKQTTTFDTEDVADDVALVLIEKGDTDPLAYGGTWEAEYRKAGLEIVFAGGPFTGTGGVNRIADA